MALKIQNSDNKSCTFYSTWFSIQVRLKSTTGAAVPAGIWTYTSVGRNEIQICENTCRDLLKFIFSVKILVVFLNNVRGTSRISATFYVSTRFLDKHITYESSRSDVYSLKVRGSVIE